MSGESAGTAPVRLLVDGAIGTIKLARPNKLNALDRATLEGLTEAAAWFDDRPEITVVVVRAAGSSFSAGFDLVDPSWSELGGPEESGATGRAMADAVGAMQAITVASIRGHCIGGGIVLAAACDLRLASVTTTFRIPEVDLGVPLYWSGVPRLVRELGPALTKELILTGRPFGPDEAKAFRFVNEVVADEKLDGRTAELAALLAAKPARVLQVTKRQVEAAAPALPDGSEDSATEVAGFAAAFADPECLAAAASYSKRPRR